MHTPNSLFFIALVILALGVVVTILFGVIVTLRRGQRGTALGASLIAHHLLRMTGHSPPTPAHR